MSFFTGVGSRDTPLSILQLMERIASRLERDGYTLRSGAADGADVAFQQGTSNAVIYLPWHSFQPHVQATMPAQYVNVAIHPLREQAEQIASEVHPAWHRCSPGARKLHTRNVFQILGDDLFTPSSFCVLWARPTSDGHVQGGTNTALQLCHRFNVPAFNLAQSQAYERITSWLGEG